MPKGKVELRLNELEAQINALDPGKEWPEIGCLLYLVGEKSLYKQDQFASFKQWTKSGKLKKLGWVEARKKRDAYKTLCAEGGIDIHLLSGLGISKVDPILPLWSKVQVRERSRLISLMKDRSQAQIARWAREQKRRSTVDMSALEDIIQEKEVEVCKRILKDNPYFLGGDIKFIDQQWRLGQEKGGGTLDLVGRSKSRSVMVLAEVKTDPVEKRHVGQALLYQNYAREMQKNSGKLEYRKGARARRRAEVYDLEGVEQIVGVIVGSEYERSAYYTGLGTELIFYRADKKFKRVIASVCMKHADRMQWEEFISWSDHAGRKDFCSEEG